MRDKHLRKLNQCFEKFGRQMDGRLNFRWLKTTQMQYVHDSPGQYEQKQLASGLWISTPFYRIYEYAKLYGACWCMARLSPPMDEPDWKALYGETFPWDRTGHYCPIDSTFLPPEVEPNEALTEYAVIKLEEYLNMTPGEARNAKRAEAAQKVVEFEKQWSDFIDDSWCAFTNSPGAKEHVSFPSVKKAGLNESVHLIRVPPPIGSGKSELSA